MRARRTLLQAAVLWTLCSPGQHQAVAQALRPGLKAPVLPSVAPAAPLALAVSVPMSAGPETSWPDLPLAGPPQGLPAPDLLLAPPQDPAAPPVAPEPVLARPESPLFTNLDRKGEPRSRRMFGLSLLLHAGVIAAVLMAPPMRTPTPAPEPKSAPVRIVFYSPPPPPLGSPKGSPQGKMGVPQAAKPKTIRPKAPKPQESARRPIVETKPPAKTPVQVDAPVADPKLVLPQPPAAVGPAGPRGPVQQPEWGTAEEGGSVDMQGGGVPWGAMKGVSWGALGGIEGGIVGGTGDSLRYDRLPRLREKLTLPYPEAARARGIQGLVRLVITVDETGRVVNARVVKSIPELDRTAVSIVYLWRFEPAVRNGKPVPSTVDAAVNFVLVPSSTPAH